MRRASSLASLQCSTGESGNETVKRGREKGTDERRMTRAKGRYRERGARGEKSLQGRKYFWGGSFDRRGPWGMLHSQARMSAAVRSHATRSESSAEHAKGRARSLQKHEAKQEGQDKPGWKGRQEVFRTPRQERGVAETPRPPSPPPPPAPSNTQCSRLILSPPPLRSIIPLIQRILKERKKEEERKKKEERRKKREE